MVKLQKKIRLKQRRKKETINIVKNIIALNLGDASNIKNI